MFNSCKFNGVKYNSVCVAEAVTPVVPGQVQIYKRRRRLQRIVQHFEFVGTKLINEVNQLEFIGTGLYNNLETLDFTGSVLFTNIETSTFIAQLLTKKVSTIELNGALCFPFNATHQVNGRVKILTKDQIEITASTLFLGKQQYIIKGIKSLHFRNIQKVNGKVQFPYRQKQLIRGKKDLTNIFESLDLFDIGD